MTDLEIVNALLDNASFDGVVELYHSEMAIGIKEEYLESNTIDFITNMGVKFCISRDFKLIIKRQNG